MRLRFCFVRRACGGSREVSEREGQGGVTRYLQVGRWSFFEAELSGGKGWREIPSSPVRVTAGRC